MRKISPGLGFANSGVRTLLKLPNPVDRDAVQVTIDTGINQGDLFLHGHGRVLLLPFTILDSKG